MDEFRDAIARITIENTEVRGTGFLVAPDLVATALHVVADRETEPPIFPSGKITLHFQGRFGTGLQDYDVAAEVVHNRWNQDADCVLLECKGSVDGRPTIPLRGLSQSDGQWKTYGYPESQPIDGMVWDGKVNTTYGRLTSSYATRRAPYEPVLQLYSDQAAAGTGGLPKGLSGAPVMVGIAAVGLLRTSLLEGEQVHAGTLYACSAKDIVELWPERLKLLPALAVASAYQLRLDRLFDDHRLFGGRDDELQWLDDAIAGETGGYAFVTGRSGSGKTALLINWVRWLRALPPRAGKRPRLAYAFISKKDDLADQQRTLELLCEQLQRVRGRQEPLPDKVPALQDRYTDLLGDPAPEGERLVVVIDGLDEAQDWTALRLLFPRTLPRGVYIVFSAREVADRDWLNSFQLDARVPMLRVLALSERAISSLLGNVPRLAARAGDVAFVKALYQVSGGDPFYLKFLLEDLAALPAPTVADVQAKPVGLKSYLDRWWNDVAQRGKSEKSVRDFLSYLVVALGAIGRDELIEIDAADALDSFTIDDAVEAVRRYVIGGEASGYALSHPRFREYLVTRISTNDQRPYREQLGAWCAAAWSDTQYNYPLAHVVGHLAERRAKEPVPKRAAVTDEMLALVRNGDFVTLKLGRPDGLTEYEGDCRATVIAAVADPLPVALPTIVGAALAMNEPRRVSAGATRVFERAQAGAPEPAADRLPLIAPDADWLATALLVAAWLCAARDRDRAREFLAAHADALQPEALPGKHPGTLELLDARTRAAIEGTPEPALVPPYRTKGLPRDVPPELARGIVARIGGASERGLLENFSMIATLNELIDYGDETPAYIAEGDSPWLVSYAIAKPQEGESLIRRYVQAHAENPYGVYRNRSLWGVLGSVLCHPDPILACDFARVICEAAYNPATVEYREMLSLAALATVARLDDAAAKKEIASRIKIARAAAKRLHPLRGEADTWGHHARRFAALAEVIALTGLDATAAQLLDRAARLPFGYAGYQAPASLALADANLVCRPEARSAIDGALDAARRAAHNVQESRFCALTTARMNAIAQRWRPGTIRNIAMTVERFASDPRSPEFAPVHVVGEHYPERSAGPNMLPIPPQSLAARSLVEIAQIVYGMPVARLEQLNPGIDPEALLAPGTRVDVLDTGDARVREEGEVAAPEGKVNVSDSGFAPLLAARFAAEALARRAELGNQTAALIAKLVPVAASNATALDLVLARLLLIARPDDRVVVERVRACAPDEWMRSPVPNRNIEA